MVSTFHIPRFVVRAPQFVSVGRPANACCGDTDGKGSITLTVWEDSERVYVEADLPGSKPADVDVRIEDGLLKISGERSLPQREAETRHNERRFGAFERVLPLGKTLDPTKVDAALKDGVLSIVLHKRPEAQTQKVTVKYGSDAPAAPTAETLQAPQN